MKYKPFGRTGVDVAVIGQGTWDMPESGARKNEAIRAIRRGIDLGMTHLDTAEMYGSGGVERLLGEAIAGIDREKLFVASKLLPSNASYRRTIEACDRSLRHLRLDHLDLYMLHWPSSEPLEETMRALSDLVRAGKTRFVGVSNFDVEEMFDAQALLGDIPLACNQVLYHLRERRIEHRLIPEAKKHGIAIVAYTPFGRGGFSRDASGIHVLESIARKYGASVHQVILAFLTRESNVFTIPKASSVPHVEENAAAAGIELARQDIDAIDEAFPPAAPGPLAML